MSKPKQTVYRIFFTSQGKGYEIYARKVGQGEMYGFVEIEDIVFGEKSAIVVDPNEDALKKEFASVKRLLIPYHSVSRIDEVEKEGQARIVSLAMANPGSDINQSLPPHAPVK
ncbi:MAG: DUF1820 family protein [Desulfuromonadales bacterium]